MQHVQLQYAAVQTTAVVATDDQSSVAVGRQSAVATSAGTSVEVERLQKQLTTLHARHSVPTQRQVCASRTSCALCVSRQDCCSFKACFIWAPLPQLGNAPGLYLTSTWQPVKQAAVLC